MPLAQGGMGLVFAGRLIGAHGVERLVAIKTLRPITSASDRAALLREAKLTARLHRRNVVATLDLVEVDDVQYVYSFKLSRVDSSVPLVEASGSVTYETLKPNGPECAPTCKLSKLP